MIFKDATNKQLKDEVALQKRLEILRGYSGSDRVVPIQEALSKLPKEKALVPTGMTGLDRIIKGFKHGELVVVSGPTGEGKTTLLQSFTYHFSDNNIPCLWFSYEVGVRDLSNRFNGMVPNFHLPNETVVSNFKWLEQRIWEGIAKYETQVVFIDHLHYLLDMGELAKTNTSLAIGHLVRRLKRLSVTTGTIIFLVSHLTKTRFEEVPEISDLRDSSFVGQESDFVFLIWRDKKKSFLKVAKNRRTGTLKAVPIYLQNGRFYELAR